MAYIVRVPKLGVEMEQGEVLTWFVEEQDSVEAGDVIAEIESEKSIAEIEARESGVVRRIVLREGEVGEPGTPMAIVAASDADVSDLERTVEEEASRARTESEVVGDRSSRRASPDDGGGPEVDRTGATTEAHGVRATPRAKKLAESHGVNLATVDGTGPRDAVTGDDVLERVHGGTSTRGTVQEERELRGIRSTIARRLAESERNAVHVTVDRDVEVEGLFDARERANEASDVDVSLTDVLLTAVSEALEEHPAFNGTFEDGIHRVFTEHNIGIAVDVEDGLLTPVIPDVSKRSVADIARKRRELIEAVRSEDYTDDQLSGGTFTVSNLGTFGSDSFTPIINPPEVAILGVNRVRRAAKPSESGIEWVRQITFSLSFDHRLLDGADGAHFLTTLDDRIQDRRNEADDTSA